MCAWATLFASCARPRKRPSPVSNIFVCSTGWSARPARRRGRPQHEGPAQAAHVVEGEEEVVALSKFMCARHACGAAGRRPPLQRAQRATVKALYIGRSRTVATISIPVQIVPAKSRRANMEGLKLLPCCCARSFRPLHNV